ncbi:hypothetical protein P4O66_021421 [Electrophorus voltai]|uniref:Family with sequence similarity 155 member A n=1 Tax=Electrophorus voltai TaxID=2609070 RepID=A0AAD8ZQ61_9TELE|nr:hypothetical protein P4O66_021421 [Electrophorus voltai]
MTSGAWKCRQRDDGLKIWFAPRENEKPFTDSERAQRWRLSLASLLFLTVLLSDHLWFCAEAKSTGTRDKEPDKLASVDTGAYPSVNPKPNLPPANSSLRRNEDAIFIENSTKPTWSLETCHADSLSKNCFTFVNADHLCTGLSETNGTRSVDLKDLYLSFCNSYSLMDLFNGSSPDNLTCSLDVIMNDLSRCSQCVQAYQRYDLHAQEKYEEFEIMTERYETDVYSVRTCMDECRFWRVLKIAADPRLLCARTAAKPIFQPSLLLLHLLLSCKSTTLLSDTYLKIVQRVEPSRGSTHPLTVHSALHCFPEFHNQPMCLDNDTVNDCVVSTLLSLAQLQLKHREMVYKPWLCAQYFQGSQSNCSHRVSCERYCLEVQQKCPFILPDNDDLIHGGTPSFICTGLPEKPNAEEEQCCDVRWELKTNNRLRGTFRRTHPSCQHTSMSASGAPRLGQGRLKLCLLVLVLLHTVATMTANQNSTCLATIFPLEDNAPREE